jgi:hypothetical protein
MRLPRPKDRLSSDDVLSAAAAAGYLETRAYRKDELIYVPAWLGDILAAYGFIELVK